MKTITLNNGVKMPLVGLGTFGIPSDKMSQTIAMAYEMGYRQFDTAWQYGNEADLSQALKENSIKREDVFLTTKLSADALYVWGYRYGKHRILNIRNFKSIERAILESFDHLQTDYIDLFLVHWPWPMFMNMYKCLSDLYSEGKIRAIGVCSFLPPHLEALKEVTDVVPAINQFEISPLNTQKRLIKYCQDRNIATEAMASFSHFRDTTPRQEIFQNPVLQNIASQKGKSVVQIVLKWQIQQNIIVIPKSCSESHLRENISLFDFELNSEEMEMIDSLDQGVCLNYNPYLPHIIQDIPKKYRSLKW